MIRSLYWPPTAVNSNDFWQYYNIEITFDVHVGLKPQITCFDAAIADLFPMTSLAFLQLFVYQASVCSC